MSESFPARHPTLVALISFPVVLGGGSVVVVLALWTCWWAAVGLQALAAWLPG